MVKSFGTRPHGQAPSLRLAIGAIAAVTCLSTVAPYAQAEALAYSFEDGTDGFVPNGTFITTVAQDTIGATVGNHSLKVALASAAFFAGPLTAQLDPLVFGDPPGLNYVDFDMTLPAVFGPGSQDPVPGFAVIGVIVFGVTQTGDPVQAQFNHEVHIDGREAGTYLNTRVYLTEAGHPVLGETASFNEIFGVEGGGETDVIPTSFELFINKTGSSNSANKHPLTIYLDNIRFGTAVEGDYNSNNVVDAADYTVWRDNLSEPGAAPNPMLSPAEGDGDGDGLVTMADYEFWKARFGNSTPGGVGSMSLAAVAVPEPSTAWLLIGYVVAAGIKRKRNRC